MKKLLLLLIILSSIPFAQAQLGIKFSEMEHNFGMVDQSKGVVSTRFVYKNTGRQPLRIISVRPFCGCTSSEFTKDTLMPGESGYISAEFDPLKSLKGGFKKTIEVQFNLGTYKLYVAGTVYNSVQDEIKAQTKLIFSKTFTKLGTLNYGDVVLDTITIKNPTDYEQVIRTMTTSTGNIELSYSKMKLPPGESAQVYVKLTINDIRMLGASNSGFTLLTSDHYNPMMAISYDHYVNQKFPKLTKKYLKTAPKFSIDKKEVDYDYVKPGSLHKTSFKITNKGKSTLKILKHESACSCLTYEIEKTEIEPGETISINSTFDTVLRNKGENTKYITLITNDPLQQDIKLKHFYILIP